MSGTSTPASALRGTVFRGRDAVARGLLTPAQLRSSAWQPVFHGIYADAACPLTHRARCVAAARLVLPPDAGIAGRSAAHLYGAGSPARNDPVEAVVAPGTRIRAGGLRVRTCVATAADIHLLDGLRVTTPGRTCWDLAQTLSPVDAVVIMDQLVARRIITVASIDAYARARTGHRGWRRLLHVATLVEPGAGSPQESRMRVRLVLAGLPRPVPQYIIEDNGRFLARVDLAWPEFRVAVEYDGLWHAGSAEQIHADRRRLNRLVGSDWVVLHLTSKRMRDDFEGFVAEVRAALHARRPR